MMFRTVALLALSATTLAHPGKRAAHHHHHKWGTGRGTGTGGVAAPTGGAFPMNGTHDGNGTLEAGSSSAVVSAITETVIPLAASTSAASDGQFFAASSSAVAPVASEAAGTAPLTAEAASESESCSSTITTTLTSTDYITMTLSSGTSTVSAAGNVQAFHPSDSFSSAAAPVTTSTAAASTAASSASASDAPAGFFQKSSAAPSVSYGGFGTSSAASAMTTFATSAAASSVVASSAAAASSTPASSSSSSSSSGGKKGLSYNSAALTDAFANTGMSWAYNWGASPGGTLVSGVEFIPMLWGLDSVDAWSSAAASAISSGSSAALSFNEPDLSTQSNIDPTTAAKNHITYMNPLSVRVGSPAITNGAGTSPYMGIDWLNAFFTACAGQCKVDFVAFHWYSDASQTDYFKQHVTDVINAAAANGVSKVWLTEFGTTGGDTASFLQEVMPFLESTAAVEKYAFFMCAAPQTLTGTSLNSVGQTYASG